MGDSADVIDAALRASPTSASELSLSVSRPTVAKEVGDHDAGRLTLAWGKKSDGADGMIDLLTNSAPPPPPTQREAFLQSRLKEELRRPFPTRIKHGPLLYLHLFPLAWNDRSMPPPHTPPPPPAHLICSLMNVVPKRL